MIRDPQMYTDMKYAVWSPDGKRIATTGWHGLINIWESRSGRHLHRLIGHVPNRFIRILVWSTDGGRLASGGWDQSVKIWDTNDGREIHSLDSHSTNIRSVQFSPDGTRLVSSDWSGSVRLWDTRAGEQVMALEDSDGDAYKNLRWSRDGRTLWVRTNWRLSDSVDYSKYGEPWALRSGRTLERGRTNKLHETAARYFLDAGLSLARSGSKVSESNLLFSRAERLTGVASWARRSRAIRFLTHEQDLTDAAEHDLQIAVRQSPTPSAKNELAWILANRYDGKARDPRQAEELASELVKEWPETFQFWITLGLAQYRQGQWQEARNSLQQAIELRPNYGPLAHMVLGMVLCQLGQVEQARHEFERSDSQWPSSTWPNMHGVKNVNRLIEEARTLLEKTAGERGKAVPELEKAG